MIQPEAFSRILIDKALEFSGWDLLKPQQVQFELHTGNGRADYLLKDSLGRVLCVLEAKREGLAIHTTQRDKPVDTPKISMHLSLFCPTVASIGFGTMSEPTSETLTASNACPHGKISNESG